MKTENFQKEQPRAIVFEFVDDSIKEGGKKRNRLRFVPKNKESEDLLYKYARIIDSVDMPFVDSAKGLVICFGGCGGFSGVKEDAFKKISKTISYLENSENQVKINDLFSEYKKEDEAHKKFRADLSSQLIEAIIG